MAPVSFTYGQEGPVFRIDSIDLDWAAPYESALVLPLDPTSGDKVNALRRAHVFEAPPWKQLTPHLTLLFFGSVSGAALSKLLGALNPLRELGTTTACLDAIGWFGTQAGLGNAHLLPSARQPFHAMHRIAEHYAEDTGWSRVTPWSDDAYCPHVTIWDDVPRLAFERLSGAVRAIDALLEPPIIIGRRLNTVKGFPCTIT